MASFKKRGKTWEYTISTKDSITGKYKRITKAGFRTKAEASNAAVERELLIKGGYAQNINISLYNYFKQWMEIFKKPAVSARTYSKYETTLNSIKIYFEDKSLTNIDKKTYQRIINEFAKTHAPASTSKFNNHVRQCVKNAYEEKVITTNFTNNAVISGTNITKKAEDKFLNYEDTKLVISHFKVKLNPKFPSYYMIILAFITGLRYGELLGLTWEDIFFEDNKIDINKSYDYHTHSGFIETKTYSSCRTVYIDESTTEMLKLFKNDQKQLFEQFQVINPLNQVFYHYIEGIISNNAVNQSLRRGLKQLGITPSITMHGARHTFGSILIYKGVDLAVVSEILGHKDTTVTSKVYLHVIKELREKNKLIINQITSSFYSLN